MTYINTLLWLQQDKEIRVKLAEMFKIPKTGLVEVVTDAFGKSQVKSDGHTNADLQVLTVERMQEYLETMPSDISMEDLFKMVVTKAGGVKHGPEVESATEMPSVVKETVSGIPESKFACDKCEYKASNKGILTMHKKNKHGTQKS